MEQTAHDMSFNDQSLEDTPPNNSSQGQKPGEYTEIYAWGGKFSFYKYISWPLIYLNQF